jgi:DNA-binding transcriptional MerR regulator
MSLQDLLSTAEAAERAGVPVDTFRYWRMVGKTPPGRRFGTVWIYCQDEVDAWIRRGGNRRIRGTNGQQQGRP